MCRLLLANQDTELTKSQWVVKANESLNLFSQQHREQAYNKPTTYVHLTNRQGSGVDWGGPPSLSKCGGAFLARGVECLHGQMIMKKQGG